MSSETSSSNYQIFNERVILVFKPLDYHRTIVGSFIQSNTKSALQVEPFLNSH